MQAKPSALANLPRVVLWTITGPFLALWPFLSAMPAFTLMGGNVTLVTGTVNWLLLATGFWAVAPIAAVAAIVLSPAGREARRKLAGSFGLPLSIYAAGWTAIYLLLAFFGA